MPYKKQKKKCTQSDGDKGSYVLSYTTKKGEKRSACHTSQKKMQGQIAAIEGPREDDALEGDDLSELRLFVREVLTEQAVDLTKQTADSVVGELISKNAGLKLGRRKDRVNRVYPADPTKPASFEDFKNMIQSTFNPKVLEVVPPKQSKLGFSNSSGKFPALIFTSPNDPEKLVPVMLAQGANQGEAYENDMVTGLKAAAAGGPISPVLETLLSKIGLTNEQIIGSTVKQTKPNPRKLTGTPYDIGAAIADIIIEPSSGAPVYLSIKNLKGSTFGNHGYAGGFKQEQLSDGTNAIVPGTGPGSTDDFVTALGIDKEKAAEGFTNYLNSNPDSPSQVIEPGQGVNQAVVKSWLASGVGFGYYYVRETSGGSVEVKPILDAGAAEKFVGDVSSVTIRYPQGPKISKQITVKVKTTVGSFNVEIRNSSGKVIPNELKLKITKVNEAAMQQESNLREYIRSALLTEAIVSFEGIDYDVPNEEVESIKNQIEFGSADPSSANSRVFDSAKAVVKLKKLMGEKYQEVADKAGVYPSDTKSEISKVLVNNPELFADTVFTISPSLGLKGTVPGPEWIEMINVHRPGRSKAVGRGEIALSLLLQGVTPDSGSGTHDLNIAGIGEVHVKETASSGGIKNPDVPMGLNFGTADKQAAWAQSLAGTTDFDGSKLRKSTVQLAAKAILDKFADVVGLPEPTTINDYNELANTWQENFIESFIESASWGGAAGVAFINKESGEYLIIGPDDAVPSRISDDKWRVGRRSSKGELWANYFKGAIKKQLSEAALRKVVGRILTEDLDRSDRAEIKRLIKKELEGPTGRKEIDKSFKKNFDKELKKTLGSSFFGTPGKVNKFVTDEIQKEVERSLGSTANKEIVVRICKDVITKLYRELSFSYKPMIDRMKV